MLLNILFLVIGIFLAGAFIVLSKHMRMPHKPAWLARAHGEVPWSRPRAFSFTNAQGGTQTDCVFLVSRHDIAECGLTCPLCSTIVADRADFSRVYRAIVDGQENEVIQCPGKRKVEDGREVNCRAWLVASPTTEHGDHLDDDGKVNTDGSADRPEFFKFKRITAARALREEWGVDIEEDSVVAPQPIAEGEPVPLAERIKAKRHEVLMGEELRLSIAAAVADLDAQKTAPPNPGEAPTAVSLPVITPPPSDP